MSYRADDIAEEIESWIEESETGTDLRILRRILALKMRKIDTIVEQLQQSGDVDVIIE